MIRINLLPHKKKTRSVPIEGEKTIAVGMGILFAAAALVFLFVHRPMVNDMDEQAGRNAQLDSENKKIEAKTKNFEELKAAFEAAKTQAAAIESLNSSRSTPAWFLYELATVLRRGGEPTITDAMRVRVANDENLQWQEGWDPQHIWLKSIKETKGVFTLVGLAQSDGDVTQLAHRLNASMYFEHVQPETSVKQTEKKSGVNLYQFTITGTVRY